MDCPYPAAAWPGGASGLLYVIQGYITDTLERFSAPNLSTVGTEPLGLVFWRISEFRGTSWAVEM